MKLVKFPDTLPNIAVTVMQGEKQLIGSAPQQDVPGKVRE